MCSLNKKWIYTVIGLLLIGAGIFCIGILQTRKTDALRDDPVYGDWKVTRIVTYEPMWRYGQQYLGSELGRTISITRTVFQTVGYWKKRSRWDRSFMNLNMMIMTDINGICRIEKKYADFN